MMMSIALRFIPILVEETDKIMKAQMARGADFEKRKYHSESEEHDSAPRASVYLRVPAGYGSGYGHGGEMLPRRRGLISIEKSVHKTYEYKDAEQKNQHAAGTTLQPLLLFQTWTWKKMKLAAAL